MNKEGFVNCPLVRHNLSDCQKYTIKNCKDRDVRSILTVKTENLDFKAMLRNHEHTATLNAPNIMLYRSEKGNMVIQFNGLSETEQDKLKAFMELVVCHGLDVVAWFDNSEGLPFEEKRISYKP